MKDFKKVYIKSLGGYIYIENYRKNNEEEDRAKVYDENMQYLDYISLDGTTKQEYLGCIKEYRQAKDIIDFIDNCLFYNSYDYSENLEYLLYSILDGQDEQYFEELENDLKTLNEKELLTKYMINNVGNYYFYLGDY